MLWTRIASAVVLGPLFLAIVYFESPYFNFLVAALAGLMAWEFVRMDAHYKNRRRSLIIAASVLSVAVMSTGKVLPALTIIGLATVGLVIADQVAGRKGLHMVQIAVVYVALPALSLLYIVAADGSFSIFWLLAVVWATDIGAYAAGRIIGGPKLAPRISPNKTWSGAVGGLVSAVLASAGVLYWGAEQGMTVHLAFIAAGVSVVSQLGDLFESALKRRYQIKDSSNLIPGHGGFMDRFDGLWAAAPVAAALCLILGGGVRAW